MRVVRQMLARVENEPSHGRGIPEMKQHIATAIELRDIEKELESAGESARKVLGRHWKDGEPTWSDVEAISAWAGELRSLAVKVARDDIERAATLRGMWAQLASEAAESLLPSGPLGMQFTDFQKKAEAFLLARESLSKLLEPTGAVWVSEESPDAAGLCRRRVAVWQAELSNLREWCAWRRVRAEGVRHGLAPLVTSCEAGNFPSQDLPRVFERSYGQWCWRRSPTASLC